MFNWLRRFFKKKKKSYDSVFIPKIPTVVTHPSDCISSSSVPSEYDHIQSSAVDPGSYIVMDPINDVVPSWNDWGSSSSESGYSPSDYGNSSSDSSSSTDFGGGSGDGGGASGSWD